MEAKEGTAELWVSAGRKASHGDEFEGVRAVRRLTSKERRGRMLVSLQPMSDAVGETYDWKKTPPMVVFNGNRLETIV